MCVGTGEWSTETFSVVHAFHCPLLTAHCSLPTAHCSLPTAHCLLLHFQTMNRISNDDNLLKLRAAFTKGGVRGAVTYLNSLTEHRFTSLYRFDGPTLRNITFFDRENPTVESCDDIPVEASYCVFVRDLATSFMVDDAMRDARVSNHPKKATVQSYCGVPLLDRNGKMFGSICHFDFEPRSISDRDVELLEYMARLLQHQF